jgi:hypothetical protein
MAVLVVLLFFTTGSAWCDTLVLGANSDSRGATIGFTNSGSQSFMKLAYVDPNVNRLRIVNGRNMVFFDDHPESGKSFYLPPGGYTATAWSAYGTTIAVAVRADYMAAPPVASSPAAQAVKGNVNNAATTTLNTGDYLYPPYYFYNYNNRTPGLNLPDRHNDPPRSALEMQQSTVFDSVPAGGPSTLGPDFSPPSTLGPGFGPPSTLGPQF